MEESHSLSGLLPGCVPGTTNKQHGNDNTFPLTAISLQVKPSMLREGEREKRLLGSFRETETNGEADRPLLVIPRRAFCVSPKAIQKNDGDASFKQTKKTQ